MAATFKVSLGAITKKLTLPNGVPQDWTSLVSFVKAHFGVDPLKDIALSYSDEEGDKITISATRELVEYLRETKNPKFELMVFEDVSKGLLSTSSQRQPPLQLATSEPASSVLTESFDITSSLPSKPRSAVAINAGTQHYATTTPPPHSESVKCTFRCCSLEYQDQNPASVCTRGCSHKELEDKGLRRPYDFTVRSSTSTSPSPRRPNIISCDCEKGAMKFSCKDADRDDCYATGVYTKRDSDGEDGKSCGCPQGRPEQVKDNGHCQQRSIHKTKFQQETHPHNRHEQYRDGDYGYDEHHHHNYHQHHDHDHDHYRDHNHLHEYPDHDHHHHYDHHHHDYNSHHPHRSFGPTRRVYIGHGVHIDILPSFDSDRYEFDRDWNRGDHHHHDSIKPSHVHIGHGIHLDIYPTFDHEHSWNREGFYHHDHGRYEHEHQRNGRYGHEHGYGHSHGHGYGHGHDKKGKGKKGQWGPGDWDDDDTTIGKTE